MSLPFSHLHFFECQAHQICAVFVHFCPFLPLMLLPTMIEALKLD